MAFVKRYIWWVILGAAFYFVLSYHFIIIGRGVKLLKKSEITLEYTFYSTKGKRVATILAVDELREDGIGDLLVERGMITEEELEKLIEKYEEEEDDG
jgi:hypothetical protein